MTKPSSRKRSELTPPAPARRARQVLWATMPIWSAGMLSFAPFLAYAIMRRRKSDWARFAAYLAASIVLIVLLVTVGHGNGGGQAVAGLYLIALVGGAAVHASMLFRPPTAAVAPVAVARVVPLSTREHNKEAIAEAKDRIERRKDARRLAETNPALAREMHIGRPDVPRRDYDDGGLVDVNHVPGAVLAANLGLTKDEVTDVMAARDKLGRFTSADELCAYTELSPDRVDELRDLMIFS